MHCAREAGAEPVKGMYDAKRLMAIFAATSLAAVGAGCVAMSASGVASSSWLRTLVAWAVGGVLAALLARPARQRRAPIGALVIATAALTATLFATPVDGVHRWIDLGPLHVNAAALCLPAVIVALSMAGLRRPIGLTVALITAIVLLLQPDASQLTAFAIAASILVIRSGAGSRFKAVALLIATGFSFSGWMRPDPLQPVAEVEGIFAMALAVSPLLALFAGVSLAAAALAPLALSSRITHPERDGALTLTAYLVAVSIAPFLGSFPVPLVGLGMSFPVGWWLGVAMLAGTTRAAD
jgi:hypothetical protein